MELKKPLHAIGEALKETRKRRFVTSTAPDGAKWGANKEFTLTAYGARFGAKARGALVASKKPLIGEAKRLSGEINFRVTGNSVEICSPVKYGAVQQFVARRGAFGKTRRGVPIPWGDIPARPFIGVSKADDLIEEHRVPCQARSASAGRFRTSANRPGDGVETETAPPGYASARTNEVR